MRSSCCWQLQQQQEQRHLLQVSSSNLQPSWRQQQQLHSSPVQRLGLC
jgi:hypothetical protein